MFRMTTSRDHDCSCSVLPVYRSPTSNKSLCGLQANAFRTRSGPAHASRPTVDAYTVRFNQPLKRTVILDLFAQMKVKQLANVTYFGNDEPFGPALHFLDDRTFILSNQVLLQQIIQAP